MMGEGRHLVRKSLGQAVKTDISHDVNKMYAEVSRNSFDFCRGAGKGAGSGRGIDDTPETNVRSMRGVGERGGGVFDVEKSYW